MASTGFRRRVHAGVRWRALLLAACALAAGPAQPLDLSNPRDAHRAMLKVIGDLDGRPVFKDWDVTILAVLPGEKPRPILRMQGYNVGRLLPRPDGGHEWVTREVSYYQDLATGKIIERWDNPFTGRAVCVVQVANDPVSNLFPPATAQPNPFTRFGVSGEVASLRWDIPLAYPNALPPSEFPDESTGPTYLASEHFTFFARTADLVSDKLTSVPTHYAWFRTGPWLPWMMMGQRPGYLVYSGHGRKLGAFDELPAQVREYTLRHHPAYATAPDRYYQPNETSWTYYARLKRDGRLPRDCP
jgi:hypothetical protein